jgi:hypothetical protein
MSDNPFERTVLARGDYFPGKLRDSFIYVHDTLETCKTVAESVFGKINTLPAMFYKSMNSSENVNNSYQMSISALVHGRAAR